MSNFQPLEIVGRGSEAQLQVDGNLGYLTVFFSPWQIYFLLILKYVRVYIRNYFNPTKKQFSYKVKYSKRVLHDNVTKNSDFACYQRVETSDFEHCQS